MKIIFKKLPCEFVIVHVQNSQEAVSGKNTAMNFTHIVVGDIEPQKPNFLKSKKQ